MFGEIAYSFQSGNVYILALIILGCLASILIFERFIMLQFVYHINFEKFLTQLKKLLNADDLDRALSFCKSAGNTSLPYIARKAIEAADTDPTTIRPAIEEETIAFLPRIEARVNFIAAISTIVMFLGILGTIDALWETFHAIDILDSTKKQVSLSNEIAAALNPIALGLMICMFIVASHQIIRGMAARLVDKIHLGVTVLTNLMVPQETAFIPAMASTSGSQVEMPTTSASEVKETTTTAQGAQTDANFDDASIQDIRDEEEII